MAQEPAVEAKPSNRVDPIRQHVKYVGPKARIDVQFPVPLLSKSDAEGPPVTFTGRTPQALSPEQASQLCKVAPDTFVMCDMSGRTLKDK